MKPIIIAVKDGKVDLSLNELRKLLDDAYWQGYKDNTSSYLSATSALGSTGSKWWNEGSVTGTLTISDCTAKVSGCSKEG